MHARVATFETGGDPETTRRGLEELNRRAAAGPPEGLPAVSLLVLHSPEQGRILSITLYENEADLRKGDATLNEMSPPVPGSISRRISVDMYEVAVKLDA